MSKSNEPDSVIDNPFKVLRRHLCCDDCGVGIVGPDYRCEGCRANRRAVERFKRVRKVCLTG